MFPGWQDPVLGKRVGLRVKCSLEDQVREQEKREFGHEGDWRERNRERVLHL